MHAPAFEISAREEAGVASLELEGELDLATAPRVEAAAEELLGRSSPRKLVIGLGGVSFIDSSGLRAIVVLHQRAEREGWTLELLRPSPQVYAVFRISGLLERLNLVA